MKLQISESSAGALATLAVTARIVSGVLIDMPNLLNAGWLAIVLGSLLALPLMFALTCLQAARENQPNPLPRPLSAVFFIISVWDAATVAATIADSAGYLALNSTASIYLIIPQFALCLGCLLLNGDALGASAAIWNKFLPALLLIVILLQFSNYQPKWLTPALGPGLSSILSGALRVAGWFSLPAGLFLISKPDVQGRPSRLHPLRFLLLSTAFSSLIAVIFSMTTPLSADETLFSRTFRFDALLANGRNGLSLQLPTIALWYTGLFYALLFDAFTAAAMLQKFLPNQARNTCIWLSLICTALFAASHHSEQKYVILASGWLFTVSGTATVLCMLHNLRKKGVNHHA